MAHWHTYIVGTCLARACCPAYRLHERKGHVPGHARCAPCCPPHTGIRFAFASLVPSDRHASFMPCYRYASLVPSPVYAKSVPRLQSCKLCAGSRGMQAACHVWAPCKVRALVPGMQAPCQGPEIGWPGTPFWRCRCGLANACLPSLPGLSRAGDVSPGSPSPWECSGRDSEGEGARRRDYQIYFHEHTKTS